MIQIKVGEPFCPLLELSASPQLKIARGILIPHLYAETLEIYFGILSGLTRVACPHKMCKNKIVSTILWVSDLRLNVRVVRVHKITAISFSASLLRSR